MTTESFITTIPNNTSFLQTTRYTFIIPNLPFAKYFCQSINLPGVSSNEIEVSTPFSSTYRHPSKLSYDSFSISFLIDEDLKVWEETYKWLVSLTRPESFSQYIKNQKQENSPYQDGILTINTNSNIPNIRIKFRNVFPVSLSGIQFDTINSADSTPTSDLTFRYDLFEFERL
jgi:hypothetical protein